MENQQASTCKIGLCAGLVKVQLSSNGCPLGKGGINPTRNVLETSNHSTQLFFLFSCWGARPEKVTVTFRSPTPSIFKNMKKIEPDSDKSICGAPTHGYGCGRGSNPASCRAALHNNCVITTVRTTHSSLVRENTHFVAFCHHNKQDITCATKRRTWWPSPHCPTVPSARSPSAVSPSASRAETRAASPTSCTAESCARTRSPDPTCTEQ